MKELLPYLLGAALVVWLGFVWSARGTTTSYMIFCDDSSLTASGDCASGWHHKSVITYTASTERQQVIESRSPGSVYAFRGCTVANTETWRCIDDSLIRQDVSCGDGLCIDISDSATDKRVGVFRYYWTRALDLLHPSRWAKTP